jgi:branched-chain amino acid transport system ATP-binding protein
MTTGLELENVSVLRGGRPVVREVTLSVAPGEVTALMGPNGAGKSSLALAISGLLRSATGRIHLGDVAILGKRPELVRAAGVAVVPEGRRLLNELSVEDNLRVATYGVLKSSYDGALSEAMTLFPELEKRLDQPASALSGGEQQMLVLAQALMSKPKALVIDELSLGLAPIVVKRLVPTVTAVAQQGVAVLLIEQFAHVALPLATRAYVMEGSRIRFSGTARQLLDDPDLLHSAYLLGAVES